LPVSRARYTKRKETERIMGNGMSFKGKVVLVAGARGALDRPSP